MSDPNRIKLTLPNPPFKEPAFFTLTSRGDRTERLLCRRVKWTPDPENDQAGDLFVESEPAWGDVGNPEFEFVEWTLLFADGFKLGGEDHGKSIGYGNTLSLDTTIELIQYEEEP